MVTWLPIGVKAADLKYRLDVQVDTEDKKITGVSRLTAEDDLRIHLSTHNLNNLLLDGKAIAAIGERLNIDIPAGSERVLSFEVVSDMSEANYIDSQNLFLTGNWFPKPENLAEYALSVTLPKGFLAVSEADTVEVLKNEKTDTFRFQFNHPVDGLSLAASRNYVLIKDNYKGISIEAYFFKEDAHLADDYLAYTKKYLAMYEKMLSAYPYRRFVIAENLFPTGYSMPTYTLLGRAVVRLPFITRTSLGHEILHQWFGNSVYIDSSRGNWAEGITNYLADHHYADLEGKGAAYRKQILVNYDAYVNKLNAMSLSDFSVRYNKAQSAIGYGKSAMVFHSLRKMVGEKKFFDTLREFLEINRFRKASWDNIQKSFEEINQIDLGEYFSQSIERDDIPRLKVENPDLVVDQGQLRLNFVLDQNQKPYRLRLPVSIYTSNHKTSRMVEVSQTQETVSLVLDELPTRVVIDEEYELMRELSPVESPAVLAKIMGKDKLLVVMPTAQSRKYEPIIHALGVEDVIYQTPEKVTFSQIKQNSVIIAGDDLAITGMLFGRQPDYQDGVRLHVHENPYNQKEVIMLVHVETLDEAKAVKRKLPHYGKYNKLVFNGGKMIYKEQNETHAGIPVLTRPPAKALEPDKIVTLDDIFPKLRGRRVIYVGEQHEKYPHHMNQLMIIKKLNEAGIKLAVGMEMFQVPYQEALDDYLAGRIDERTFLKKSAYFDKWRFDYNLYKPIIDYLKKEGIPLVALNIEGDITRKVARSGLSGLSEADKRQLPSEMDFSDSRYREDLLKVFQLHENQHQLKEFDYFLQAQILWDETMAESVHRFLASHPDTNLVVLAGNGHLKNKYGIPNRAFRRNGFPFTVIVQDEDLQPGIADFVLKTTRLKGKKAPLLGIGIDEKDNGVQVVSVIGDSPAGKAGLEKGDIIVQVGGDEIRSLVDLKFALFYTPMDSTVFIQVDRQGKKIISEIKLFDFKHR